MIKGICNYKKFIPIIAIGMNLLCACTKKKVPQVPTPPEPTKWEKIAGHYKVYDTTGVYLYEMDLIHKTGYNDFGLYQDSLVFFNFDGQFTFTSAQWTPPPANIPMGINIGGGDPLYDSINNRWDLYGPAYLENYNIFNHDTINLRFIKRNIKYYIEDVTPYFACDCKQIAVKQH